MQLIPVIDILDGIVVHAQLGQRDKYLPVESSLSSSHEAESILQALLEFNTFNTIYIADLDAILKQGDNFTLINELASTNHKINFVLDAGSSLFNTVNTKKLPANIKPIYGSENSLGLNTYKKLMSKNAFEYLSLDFKNNTLLGDDFLYKQHELWPKNIILMSLDYVGKNTGPDLTHYHNLNKYLINKNIYVAGGVRDIDDLFNLQQYKVKGVLLASCLHSGALSREDIQHFKKA